MLTFLVLSVVFIISALIASRLISAIVGPISKAIGNAISAAAQRRDERERAKLEEEKAERAARRTSEEKKQKTFDSVEEHYNRTEVDGTEVDGIEVDESEGMETELGFIEKGPDAMLPVSTKKVENEVESVSELQELAGKGEELVLFGSVGDIAAALRRDMASGKLEGFVPTYDEYGRELPAKRLDLSEYILSGGRYISELKKRKNESLADGKVGLFLDTNMIYDVRHIEREINSALRDRGLTFRGNRGIVANFQSQVINPTFSTARSLYRSAWDNVVKPMYERGIRPAARTLWKSIRNVFNVGDRKSAVEPAAATVPSIREAENSSKEFVKTRRSSFDFARVMDYAESSANVADDRFTAKSMSKDVSKTQKVRQNILKNKGRKGPKQG